MSLDRERVSVRLDGRTSERLEALVMSYRASNRSELVRRSIDYMWEQTFGNGAKGGKT